MFALASRRQGGACVIITVIVQSLGWAPAMRLE